MKKLVFISLLFRPFVESAVAQQDTVKSPLIIVEDVAKHVGELVTVYAQADDFDPRSQNKYLFFGGKYPNQQLTIIIKKTEGNVPITLAWSVTAKKSKEYFTGTIVVYNEKPDTSLRPDAARIKKEWNEKPIYFYSNGERITGTATSKIPFYPIDLKDKLVIIITKQNQIGRN